MFSVFTAGSIFRSISRVMGDQINEFGHSVLQQNLLFASFTDALTASLKSEKLARKSFPFLLLAAYISFGPKISREILTHVAGKGHPPLATSHYSLAPESRRCTMGMTSIIQETRVFPQTATTHVVYNAH